MRARHLAVRLALGIALWTGHPALSALADAGKPEAARLGLAYEVYSAGLHVLAIDLGVGLGLADYEVIASIRTTGIVGWIFDWHQFVETTGALSGDKVEPLRYRSEALGRSGRRRVEIDYAKGDVAALDVFPLPRDDEDREEVEPALRRGTVDPISALLAIVRTVSKGRGCTESLAVFDGRRRYDLVLTDRGPRPAVESRYVRVDEGVRQCDFVVHPIAGHRKRAAGARDERRLRQGRAWLAPIMAGAPATPVRIEFDGDWGETIVHLRAAWRLSDAGASGR
jgi:hypothetical protein